MPRLPPGGGYPPLLTPTYWIESAGRSSGAPGQDCADMSKKHQVVIAGAGGMGSAVGLLLRELGDFEVNLFLGDANAERAKAAAAWIREGSLKPGEVHAFHLPLEGTSAALDEALSRADILLDCLPGKEAPPRARGGAAAAHHPPRLPAGQGAPPHGAPPPPARPPLREPYRARGGDR